MPNSVVCEDISIENVGDSIYICLVNIKDLEAVIKIIVDSVIDISWINNLPTRLHKGLLAAATPTIEYIKGLCNNIKEANDTGITVNENEEKQNAQIRKDFGEYAISISALHALESLYEHRALPLIEILKEKMKGNHGFDYITLSPSVFFVFGEAKYRKNGTGAKEAAKQIVGFIEKGQPYKDSNFIDAFDEFAPKRCSEDGVYGVSIAANLSDKTVEEHIQQLLNNKYFQALLERDVIYLIFVENEGVF